MDQMNQEKMVQKKIKSTSKKLWMNKQMIKSFLAGMATMLILAVGVTSAVNPGFLTGTAAGKVGLIKYRMFPEKIGSVESNSSTKYMGEIVLFAHDFVSKDFYYLCDGGKINIEANSSLYSIYGKSFGGDGIETMGLPKLTGKFPITGMNYYMIGAFGTYPNAQKRSDGIVKNGIVYLPYDASHYSINRRSVETETFMGEISLYKADDLSKYKDVIIPCEGQKISTAKYPKLAKYLGKKFGSDASSYTLPDLRGQSPIPGAQYCISPYGNDWYLEVVPAGYMKCVSCRKIVQKSRFCMECGAAN